MKSFYVIIQDFNNQEFEPYDVIPYLIARYNEVELKPVTKAEFRQFVKSESMYQWWSRCEYEIIIAGWPNIDTQEKWDVHKQVMMNIDIITEILMNNVAQMGTR